MHRNVRQLATRPRGVNAALFSAFFARVSGARQLKTYTFLQRAAGAEIFEPSFCIACRAPWATIAWGESSSAARTHSAQSDEH
jgi:hypothetical protein